MQFHQIAVLETVISVQTFFDENKDRVGELAESTARLALDDVALQLTAQAVDQDSGQLAGQGETARQRKLREILRVRHMKPIVAIARTCVPPVPELSALTVPYGNTSSARLITAAYAMADVTSAHEAVLVANGLQPGFAARLRATAATLDESHSTRSMSLASARGATRAIRSLVKRAEAILLVLDAAIADMFELDERFLGEWERVRSVRVKPGPARGSSAAAQAPPAEAAVISIASAA